MTPLAHAMLAVFIAAWFTCAGAWIYAARFFFPMWIGGFRKREAHKGYPRKMFIGIAVFLGAFAIAFAASSVAEFWAGGWD